MPHRFIVVLLAVLVAGCDSSSGPSTISVLVPLAIGNTWVYVETDFDSTGALVKTSEYIREITDTTIIEGELYYRFNTSAFATNRHDGYWVTSGFSPAWRYVKYPALVGEITDRDTLRTAIIGPDPNERVFSETILISTVTSVSVPAGTFIAYQYESIYVLESNDKPIIKDVLYMTPGVGEIKSEHYNYLEDGTAWLTDRSELKSYTLH
jgi:hypothetical protein